MLRAVYFLASASLAWQLCCNDHEGHCQNFLAAVKAPTGTQAYVYENSTRRLSGVADLSNDHAFIGQTLQPIFHGDSDIAYLMYNDQDPITGNQARTHAHEKGVIILSDRSAVWLIHSVPLWPPSPNESYSFPAPESKYAQSFLCLSLSNEAADAVGEVLLTTSPHVYASQFPQDLKLKYPNLAAVAAGSHTDSTEPVVVQLEVDEVDTPFLYFGKSRKWGEDLGEGLVEPYYESAFAWETWQDGAGSLPAFCKGKHGCTQSSFNMAGISLGGQNWTITSDHSKWGMSWSSSPDGGPNKSPSVVCVGDINRQTSQRKRGGGTLCTQLDSLHDAFAAIVLGIEDQDCGDCSVDMPHNGTLSKKQQAPKLRKLN